MPENPPLFLRFEPIAQSLKYFCVKGIPGIAYSDKRIVYFQVLKFKFQILRKPGITAVWSRMLLGSLQTSSLFLAMKLLFKPVGLALLT